MKAAKITLASRTRPDLVYEVTWSINDHKEVQVQCGCPAYRTRLRCRHLETLLLIRDVKVMQ